MKKFIARVFNVQNIVNPIGFEGLYHIRTTDRYGKKGTVSHNVGYLKVYRDTKTGRFVSRTKLRRIVRALAS